MNGIYIMKNEVEIDKDVLKAISTETRQKILKELAEGGRTPTDLGKKLNKATSTIVEHLEFLQKVGLVKKIERPGKKWVFYELTDKGRGIVSGKRSLVILLSFSFISLLIGVSTFLISFYNYYSIKTFQVASETLGKPSQPTYYFPLNLLLIPTIFLTISIIGFLIYWRKR